MKLRTASFLLLVPLLWSACVCKDPPTWPVQFTSAFLVLVEDYGPSFLQQGAVFYDYTIKTFRADYLRWCLPLFDTPTEFNNYTCSFLATADNMYFVNFTGSSWNDNDCCLFEAGLACVPPNWLTNDVYNGTQFIRGQVCDTWWYPGTSDPSNPCYGYWDNIDSHAPVRFYGLSSAGSTILDYYGFKIGAPMVEMNKPNANCEKECTPSLKKHFKGNVKLPHSPWPSC